MDWEVDVGTSGLRSQWSLSSTKTPYEGKIQSLPQGVSEAVSPNGEGWPALSLGTPILMGERVLIRSRGGEPQLFLLQLRRGVSV